MIDAFGKGLPLKDTSLQTFYPEIDNGLNDLETALVAAMGESDPLLLTGRLGAVHEACRAFTHELARLAANPLDRIEAAARTQFERVADSFSEPVLIYQDAAKTMLSKAKAELEKIAADLQVPLIAYLVQELPLREIEALRQISAADLSKIDKTITTLRNIAVDLAPVVQKLTSGELDPRGALKEALRLFFAEAVVATEKAEKDLAPGRISDPMINQILRPLVGVYKVRLEKGRQEFAQWIDATVPPAPDWAQWIARIRTLRRLVELFQRLQQADTPKEIFTIIVELGRDFLGVDLSKLSTQLRDRLSVSVIGLVQETILPRLATLATNIIPAPADIVPALPEFVISACIAKLGVPSTSDGKSMAQKVSGDIAGIDHFLKDFAESASVTHEFDETDGELDKALKALDQFAGVPEAAKVRVRAAIEGIGTALPLYRELFSAVGAIVGRAQVGQKKLKDLLGKLTPTGNPPAVDPDAVIDTLKALRNLVLEIEQGIRDVRDLLSRIGSALKEHLDVIASAAAAGGLADAFENDLKGFKDALDQWDQNAAAGVKTTLDTLFRLCGLIATATSKLVRDQLADGGGVVLQFVPDALDPERSAFAKALNDVSSGAASAAADIAGLTIATPAKPGLGALLGAQLIRNGAAIGANGISVADAFKDRGVIRLGEVEDGLSAVSSAYEALVGRIEGIPKTLALAKLDAPVKVLLENSASPTKSF